MVLDFRRLRRGDILLAVSAAALLVAALAVGWFEIRAEVLDPETFAPHNEVGDPRTAFEAFTGTDILLLVTSLAGIVIPLVVASGRQTPRIVDVAMLGCAALLAALIVYRMAEPPDIVLFEGGVAGEPARASIFPNTAVELAWGVWIGLAASIGTLVGAGMRLRSPSGAPA